AGGAGAENQDLGMFGRAHKLLIKCCGIASANEATPGDFNSRPVWQFSQTGRHKRGGCQRTSLRFAALQNG
ncbi:hypothetical protein, partial [Salmonella enterica]